MFTDYKYLKAPICYDRVNGVNLFLYRILDYGMRNDKQLIKLDVLAIANDLFFYKTMPWKTFLVLIFSIYLTVTLHSQLRRIWDCSDRLFSIPGHGCARASTNSSNVAAMI